jgi:hypothetical protein
MGEHVFPSGHGDVAEHSAHLCALHACASLPATPHDPHSSSLAHVAGHSARHAPSMHTLFVGHSLVFSAVHPTHVPDATSQTWCCGSHAAQSLSTAHAIVGTPWSSTLHPSPSGMHCPNSEQISPMVQPVSVSLSQATQRRSPGRHRVRARVQPPHSASVAQLWSRQTPLPPPSVFSTPGTVCVAHEAATVESAPRNSRAAIPLTRRAG